MTTSKKRKKFAMSESAIIELDYLISKKQKNSKRKVYPCDVLEEVIHNAFKIEKVFGRK